MHILYMAFITHPLYDTDKSRRMKMVSGVHHCAGDSAKRYNVIRVQISHLTLDNVNKVNLVRAAGKKWHALYLEK